MIDLHLHLDGSLSKEDIEYLAKLDGVALPSDYEKHLSVTNDCKDLSEYLECFVTPLLVLQTKKAITYAVSSLIKRLASQGLIYVEIRFAPQLHLNKGLSQDEVIAAAVAGLKKAPIKAQLILCCMRGDNNHKQNIETVKLASKYLNKGVCAIDLAGAENIFPTENFKDLFALAVNLEIPFTIHAGEADGADSVYKAITYGTRRIGHGIHACNSNKTMELLNISKIPLEMCPTSNLQTHSVRSMKEYPLETFINSNIICTINTDNMSVSNTNLVKEYKLLIEVFSLRKEDIYMLLENSASAAFLSAKDKIFIKDLLAKNFNSWYQTNFK